MQQEQGMDLGAIRHNLLAKKTNRKAVMKVMKEMGYKKRLFLLPKLKKTEKAYNKLINEYSWEHIAAEYDKLYQKLLNKV